MLSETTLLNDFAVRCFRDTADRDYIHARLAYRAGLIPQFQWSALHCLEKYGKCVLLLNRIEGKGIRHELSGALKRMSESGLFEITLSPKPMELVRHLEESGAEFRYFEVSYWNTGLDVVKLDQAVWELRRYCQVLNHDIQLEGRIVPALEANLRRIRDAVANKEKGTCINGGWLEKVLGDKAHPAREPLLWKNLYFGSSRRTKVRMSDRIEAGNSPLHLRPHIIKAVSQYVFLPKEVVRLWQAEAAKQKLGGCSIH